jgi:hypothetical protein
MSIILNTSDPSGLLSAFKKAINERRVVTWAYDKDGDFTHTTEQWKNKAWFSPRISIGQLKFVIIPPQNQNISREVYAIYHGRFAESMLAHFDDRFSSSIATAMPDSGDLVCSAGG